MYGGSCATNQDQSKPQSGPIQTTIRTNPNHRVIYLGTNNLPSNKESTDISSEIADLALKLNSETRQVSNSNLTTRNYQYHKKVLEVKQHLKVFLPRGNINAIDHGNNVHIHDLNGSKVHLNLTGNKVYQIFYIGSLY